MKVLLLTLGSRGDVQPFVALGSGLKNAGHEVRLATGRGFNDLVSGNGLEYIAMDADLLALAQSPEGKAALQGKGGLQLIRQVKPMLRRVLDESWQAAQEADVVVYHPKALGGYHIAEKLGVPGFLSIPLPIYSPTKAFPVPGLPLPSNMPGIFNRLSYSIFLKILMAPYRGMINGWRRDVLGLPPVKDEFNLHGEPVKKLYCFSQHVVPVPEDWDESSIVTGYWFLNGQEGWQPPDDLQSFLAQGPAPVYVGFGSMTAEKAEQTTEIVLSALEMAGARGVLATGWGGLKGRQVPDSVYVLGSAPHDWLFPGMAAVVHHGGAGTTAAGLRAGKATVVCPFFGDQPFWGRRVEALGVGPEPIPQKKLTAERLGAAIRTATTDAGMRQSAEEIGEKIRAEDGVGRAIAVIEETVGD